LVPTQHTEILNWIIIEPNNTVTIRIAQPEMGQGIITSTAQLLAEELEVDWSRIKVEFISIATHLRRKKAYGRTTADFTSGVKGSESRLRRVGAQIRTMLVEAAAQRLGVSDSELVAENSIVTHKPTGRKLSYGELAADAANIAPRNPDTIKLKDPRDWKHIGAAARRLDTASKLDGTAIFGADVQLPSMKHAAIMVSPVFGGKLRSYNANIALSRPGVLKVVEIKGGQPGFVEGMDDAVAVVADSWWQAKTAIDAMSIDWDAGAGATVDSDGIRANLRAGLTVPPAKTLRKEGDCESAFAIAGQKLDAEYFVPYLEHATMEPMNCTALVTAKRFEVWAPTQDPERAIKVAANAANLPINKGELHVTLLGGGFGRRLEQDFVSQAVQIAKAMRGTPVKLLWTREQTTRHGFYRSSSVSRVCGGFDANGELIAWSHRIVAHSESKTRSTLGADSLLYAIPNIQVDLVVKKSHVPEGALRGVALGQNCFEVQGFMDELAKAAGKDSYNFQRALLDPEKMPADSPKRAHDGITARTRAAHLRKVLDEVARRSDWGRPLRRNQGRGLAVHEQAYAFWAVVAEVTLDGTGWFKVDRVVVVGDPGILVNPANATAQVEGSVAFGLTTAMYGEITLRNGWVVESNFDDYRILRIDEMPKVEVYWALSRQFWGGVGEAVASAVVPAVTNAIYDAGGPRIRSLPLKNHKIINRI
jgi:isoquinoline 1-oxidoreductase beta subunit